MSDQMPPMPSEGNIPRGFMAAVLKAAKGDCQCDVCKIMRKVGDEMSKGY